MERSLGAKLVGGGRVFYRDVNGEVQCVTRDRLPELADRGAIGDATTVFDTSLTTAGEWRAHFEAPARETWIGELLRV